MLRHPRPRRPAPAGLLVVLALGCGAPTSSPPLTDDATRPWRVATRDDLAGVNELVSGGPLFTNEIHHLLFANLLDEQADFQEHPPSWAPAIAERWELSDDGLELTFHLRPDARWSDGAPITSRDVLFSHAAQTSPEVAWSYADSKDVVASVSAPDERTVVYRLTHPHPYALVDVVDGRVLPEHAWGSVPFDRWRESEAQFRERLVVSGPYTIGSWRPGEELRLDPNPEYPEALGRPTRSVVFRVVPDPAARIEQLLAGRFDFADGISPLDAERLERSGEWRILAADLPQFGFVAWNSRRAPFDDAVVRRALTLAIDRRGVVDALWRGRARELAGPIPSGLWAADAELAPLPYDPGEARRLLASRGFVDADGDGVLDREGRPFRFELSTNAGNRVRGDAAVLIQEQLARVGVAAEVRTLEFRTLLERNDAGDFDATISGMSIDTSIDLRPIFHSDPEVGSWNWTGYSDPRVDELLEATRRAPDAASARPALVEIQRRIASDQPYTFLWQQQRLSAVRTGIEGATVDALWTFASLPRWRPASAAR